MATPQTVVAVRERVRAGQRERIAERRLKALEFRKAGHPYSAIARELGIAPVQAHRDVQHALAELARSEADLTASYRAMELSRLDDLLLSLQWKLQMGDYGAIDRALKIADQRARLLGLYAPVAHSIAGSLDVSIDVSTLSDEELASLARGEPLRPRAGTGRTGEAPASPDLRRLTSGV